VEQHGADDAVFECPAVAVVVVGDRGAQTLLIGQVLDERDRRVVAAERRTAQQETPRGDSVRVSDRVAPAERVAAVVHLVEDDEGAGVGDELAVHARFHGDLRVGDDGTVIVPGEIRALVAETRIQPDAHARGRVGPLRLQMLGRADDDDSVDLTALPQLARDRQGEGRLACARRRGDEEVALVLLEELIERLLLPGTEGAGRAARGTLGIGRTQHHDPQR
jgi:hypothetical protein